MEQANFELYTHVDKNFWYVKSRNDLLDRFVKKYFKTDYNVILDAGCGTGFNFELLKKYGNVTGIDNSIYAINACEEQGFQVIMDNAEKTSFDDEQFDLIVAMDLIEHCDDIKLIAEFKRILKQDGIIIFTVPAFQWLWSDDDDLAFHKRRYQIEETRKLFKDKDFKIEMLSYRYFFIALPTILIFAYQKIKRLFSSKKINSLSLTPTFINNILIKINVIENKMLNHVYFPFGIGIFGVVRKK